VRSGSTKRVASAVGDGALVVRSMHEALEEHESFETGGADTDSPPSAR
jgi:hypothetical protein